ncbi:hypothetical protein DES53_10829 [Roseimicrobium gellanilyticum]|uniref:Uncharacterized protein n=1 Tax=Roseimicrobium gellanilyticum TaxID=748857 RepID=A0A366HCZ3_9BACT|nr:hypothetical protein [Roseimicrobium gellanilyticum]RBP40323.1 hypothetical protein DES53_10829 [Roseimicrobium gellanilyticum]
MTRLYEILQPDGVRLEVEGELSEWNGKQVMLDGQGKPWLIIADEDVVTPMGEGGPDDVGVPMVAGQSPSAGNGGCHQLKPGVCERSRE